MRIQYKLNQPFSTLLCVVSFILFSSCNSIETNKSLQPQELANIRSLNLLDSNEYIIKFYSEFRNEVAGNFFTDKRLAKNWIDEHDPAKNQIASAYYPKIISIDTVYFAGSTYCPYMLVKRNDGIEFKVCANGKREEVKSFFEDAMRLWKQHQHLK